MILAYLAAPLSPNGSETFVSNIARAKRYYRNLSTTMRDHVFVADWILHCEAFIPQVRLIDGGTAALPEDPTLRVLGMARNFELIQRCDEIYLVGPRMSGGMSDELDYAKARGLTFYEWIAGEMPAWMKE